MPAAVQHAARSFPLPVFPNVEEWNGLRLGVFHMPTRARCFTAITPTSMVWPNDSKLSPKTALPRLPRFFAVAHSSFAPQNNGFHAAQHRRGAACPSQSRFHQGKQWAARRPHAPRSSGGRLSGVRAPPSGYAGFHASRRACTGPARSTSGTARTGRRARIGRRPGKLFGVDLADFPALTRLWMQALRPAPEVASASARSSQNRLRDQRLNSGNCTIGTRPSTHE